MKEKIRELFNKTNVDSILIKPWEGLDPTFNYFTNLPIQVDSNSTLILTPKKKIVLCSVLEYDYFKKFSSKDLEIKKISNRKDYSDGLKKAHGTIGVNNQNLLVPVLKHIKKIFKGRKIVDVSKTINELRSTKTDYEINEIKKACKVTDNALQDLDSKLKPNLTETQVREMLETKLREKGYSFSFPTIVASGKNSATPHHLTSNQKIKNNSVLLIDIGVRLNNYTSDITRTIFIGNAPKKIKDMYSAVYESQQAGLDYLKEGINAKESFLASEKVLQKIGFNLIHVYGHGLGIEAHDYPQRIIKESNWIFEKNNVVTAEPGIYDSKLCGIRIETDVVITKRKPKILSKSPSELIEL